jgi:chorismate--pyruvate lyase
MPFAHFPGHDPFRRALCSAPRALHGWLGDDQSLTARLRARCTDFSLRLLFQGKAAVLPDEFAALGAHGRGPLWLREVLLVADGEAVVFARSVVAAPAIPAAWQVLRHLGGRPLAAVLFDDPRVKRSPLAAARLDARDPRWHHAARAAGGLAPPPLWARRSVFMRGAAPLLITEIFLPTIARLAP